MNATITNSNAVLFRLCPCSHLQVFHPTAKMLVELSKSQDIEAGDGTTSVVVLCGSMLSACSDLLNKGIHPTVITTAFQMAVEKSEEILKTVAIPVRRGWNSQKCRYRLTVAFSSDWFCRST